MQATTHVGSERVMAGHDIASRRALPCTRMGAPKRRRRAMVARRLLPMRWEGDQRIVPELPEPLPWPVVPEPVPAPVPPPVPEPKLPAPPPLVLAGVLG